ncbi:MAG: hypothetical protein QOF51_1716, partial [Chloroflexota bacterium]|nr:hypothetical protein [Chloroflexota bacterium]
RQQVNGQQVLVIGAVLAQDQLTDAFAVSQELATTTPAGLAPRSALLADQVVGSYDAPWGAHVEVIPQQAVDLVGWPGSTVQLEVQLDPLRAPATAGTRVGRVTLRAGAQTQMVDLVTTAPLNPPDERWRLLRPFQNPE